MTATLIAPRPVVVTAPARERPTRDSLPGERPAFTSLFTRGRPLDDLARTVWINETALSTTLHASQMADPYCSASSSAPPRAARRADKPD